MTETNVKETLRSELLATVLEAIAPQFSKVGVALREAVRSILEDYDLTIHEIEYDRESRQFYVHSTEPVACALLCDEDELSVDRAVLICEALEEIHRAEPRLFYKLVRTLFKVNQQRLTLIEFYDVTLLYGSFHANKYTKAYLLTQDYFSGLDEWAERYFRASKEDVRYAFLKLEGGIDYVDEVLLQKMDTALSQENYPRAFVFAAKALCLARRLFAVRKNEIRFERGLTL